MGEIGDSFRLGEVWCSPRGMLWKVVDFDNDHRPKKQVILRQGAAGRGRKIRRDWDAVINWVRSPVWNPHGDSCLCPECFKPDAAIVEVSREVADAVAEALANALGNGHDFKSWSAEDIATDMMTHDADVATMPRDQVVEAIKGLRS